MLGQTVRESRIKKGLTQAKLARLAGVSRRHLAALEKGANVSVLVLKKVASVLDLKEIHLGSVSLLPSGLEQTSVNLPLLGETIREARESALRVENLIASAEQLLGGDSDEPARAAAILSFPRLTARRLERPAPSAVDRVADAPGMTRVRISAEVRQGEAPDENITDTVLVPENLIEKGELVFRARGDKLVGLGIEDGDLLVVELRTTGRAANAELVIGRIGDAVYIGRWWQKHGQKALMSDGMSEVTVGASARSLKVMAAINQILRES
jgi:transcriptional regulator with XRE-family HTH domain